MLPPLLAAGWGRAAFAWAAKPGRFRTRSHHLERPGSELGPSWRGERWRRSDLDQSAGRGHGVALPRTWGDREAGVVQLLSPTHPPPSFATARAIVDISPAPGMSGAACCGTTGRTANRRPVPGRGRCVYWCTTSASSTSCATVATVLPVSAAAPGSGCTSTPLPRRLRPRGMLAPGGLSRRRPHGLRGPRGQARAFGSAAPITPPNSGRRADAWGDRNRRSFDVLTRPWVRRA